MQVGSLGNGTYWISDYRCLSHAGSKRTCNPLQVTVSLSALEVAESPPALEEWDVDNGK